MTIHSMPNNKNFDDNYDRIFKRSQDKRAEVEKRHEKMKKEREEKK